MGLDSNPKFHFLLKFFGNSSVINHTNNMPDFLQGWQIFFSTLAPECPMIPLIVKVFSLSFKRNKLEAFAQGPFPHYPAQHKM